MDVARKFKNVSFHKWNEQRKQSIHMYKMAVKYENFVVCKYFLFLSYLLK